MCLHLKSGFEWSLYIINSSSSKYLLTSSPYNILISDLNISKKEIPGIGGIIIKSSPTSLNLRVFKILYTVFDAVKFVKTGSEIVGGKGGGGRSDFAQAGGIEENKIDDAFNKLKSLI